MQHATRSTQLATRTTLLWLIFWAAWAVRLWHLDASNLTYDEAATYFVANRPLPDILAYLSGAVREHPPLYYLLIHLWMRLAGSSEYSLRFFAVCASLVGVALTARLGRTLARRRGATTPAELTLSALLPALTLALFPLEVYYARDARMYTLTVVWATLSSLLFLPLLFERDSKPRLVVLAGLVFVNGLGLFTHYYLILLIVTQFISLVILRRWRASLAWCIAHGLVGLGGLVWLASSSGLSSSLSEAWGRFVPVWPTVGQLRSLLAELLFGPIKGVPWTLVYGWGALVVLGLLVAWRRSRTVGVWLTVTTLLPVALAFLMPEPPRPRYLIFLLPFAALALGQIPFLLNGRKRVTLLWLGLSALAIYNLGVYGLPRTVKWIKSDYGRTVATVSAHARPGDGVLWYGPWQWAQFHYYRPGSFLPITKVPSCAPPHLAPEEVQPVLEELLDEYQRLWVIPAAVSDVDPRHFAAGWLNAHAHPVWSSHDLSLYLPPAEHEALSLPTSLVFGDRLRLERLVADAQTVPAGESLRLTLNWTVSDTLDSDVALDLSLLDAHGHRWRQWQRVPGQWANPPSTWTAGETLVSLSRTVITDRQGLLVPQGAPPGTFTVQLAVIDLSSGAPLRPSDAAGPRPQATVDLFTFEVVEPVAPPVICAAPLCRQLADLGDFAGLFTFESPDGATLTLVGYDLGGLCFQQGHPLSLQLNWLAPTEPLPDLQLRLQLRHRSGALFWARETPIATETLSLGPAYPVGEWPSGRQVSLPIAFSIPPDATPGSADLTLSLLGPDGQPWIVGGSQRLNLGTLTIKERPLLRQLPDDLTTVQIDFGDQIGLRGYRIKGDAQPGGRLELTYAWYALRQPDRIYSVFNHLLTADGHKVTQDDGWPQDGVVLTSQWQPGEYIQDSHTLEIPADAPPGPYLLAVGLYDAANGERLLAVYDGQPLPNDQWLVPVDK